MAIRTVTIEQLPAGNFVGGGNDTLALSGDEFTLFDLTQANFSGFSTITTDDNFRIKMTSSQFNSILAIQGTWYNFLSVTGPIIDIRGKSISQVWGITADENVTIYANDVSKFHYLDGFNNRSDKLKFFGTLSEANRAAAHLAGFDTVVDDTGLTTTNPPPVISNLAGERRIVQPGQIVPLDTSGDASVSDDQGTIRKLTVQAMNSADSLRIVSDERLVITKDSTGGFDIIFDEVNIGNFSKNGGLYGGGYLYFGFGDNAPTEAVDYILHHIEFVRGSSSRNDNAITIRVADKGGRTATAMVTMAGVDGPGTGDGSQTPTSPNPWTYAVQESAALGTVIGKIPVAAGGSTGSTLSYSISDSYGGLFRIENGALVLGGKLDFEQRSSYTFQVAISDGLGGLTYKPVTINVVDTTDEIAVGSGAPEKILGGYGKDRLMGGAGSDTLGGGLDNDTLTGGSGRDVFVFDSKLNRKTNVDKITDYKVRDDSIHLDNKIFTMVGTKGSAAKPAKLNKAFFTTSDKLQDVNDYLVYNSKTGALYYDKDGSGTGKGVEFAKFKPGLILNPGEFFVI